MTARGFVAMVETLLVDRHGAEAVEEWLVPPAPDPTANALAIVALGGEVG